MILKIIVIVTSLLISAQSVNCLEIVEIPRAVERQPYRLPTTVIPESYELWLKVDLEQFTFNGSVSIEIELLVTTEYIVIHAKDIEIEWDTVKIVKSDGNSIAMVGHVIHLEEEMYTMAFEDTLLPEKYTLELAFSGTIDTELKGLYRSKYGDNKYIATTHMQPTYARLVFPCFDEPHLKAHFQVNIYNHPDYFVISNLPQNTVVGPIREEGGYVLTTFEKTPEKMSTYLLAFVVSDFDYDNTRDLMYTIFVPPGHKPSARFALDNAPLAMNALETYLDATNKFPKTDIIAIPDFEMGAMENWGLITFRAIYLLYPDTNVPARIHQTGALLLTHELAHMWFGNEVTPEWWPYVWLSEGFARFFEYLITDELQPDMRIWDQFTINNLQSAFSQDDKLTSRRMTEDMVEPIPAIISKLFDYVAYAKSGSVIRMWYEVLGAELFQKSCSEYIKLNSLKTVSDSTLFDHFQAVIDREGFQLPYTIDKFFGSWSNNAGYPLVFAEIVESTNSINLSQKRFFIDSTVMNESVAGEYIIPITITTNLDDDNTTVEFHWLETDIPSKITFDENAEFVVLNRRQIGYYRVHYNVEHWNKLAKILNDSEQYEKIHFANRAQLIDDSINIAKAGLLSTDIAFDVLYYLRNELDLIPWMAANNALNYLTRIMRGSSEYGRYENFLRAITNKTMQDFGNSIEVNNADHVGRLHRLNSLYWACYSGHSSCVEQSITLVQNYITTETEMLEEIEPLVYCTVGKHGGYKILDDLLNFMTMKLVNDRDNYITKVYTQLTGIGCTRNETIITGLLDLSLINIQLPGVDLNIADADRAHIFKILINGSYKGTTLVLRTILSQLPTMKVLMAEPHIIDIFNTLGPRIVTKELNDILSEIGHKYFLIPPGQSTALLDAYTSAKSEGNSIVENRETFVGTIESWLRENIDFTRGESSGLVPVHYLVILLVSICVWNFNI